MVEGWHIGERDCQTLVPRRGMSAPWGLQLSSAEVKVRGTLKVQVFVVNSVQGRGNPYVTEMVEGQ